MLRRRLVLVAAFAAVLLFATAGQAGAMTFRQSGRGGTVVIGPNETIDDDLYITGNTVDIRGTVRGTVFAAGNTVSVEGSVSGDVWAAGNTVRVSGGVNGGVHAAGNDVSIDGRTGGDITAAGNTVVLASGLTAGRDAALAGSSVSVAGSLGRNLFLGASNAVISGSVGGDVNAGVDRLTLTDGASVKGDLRYTSNREANIAKGASVGGRIVKSAPPQRPRVSPAARVLFAFIVWVRRLIGLLLFGLIVTLVFPLFTRRAADEIAVRPLPSLGLGFAVLFGVPIAAFFAFLIGLLVGGWWIALMAMALYVIAIAVATIVAAVFLGRWLLRSTSRTEPQLLLALLIGLVLLTLAEAVPILGAFVRFAEVVFGLGAITLALAGGRPAPAQMPPGQVPPGPTSSRG